MRVTVEWTIRVGNRWEGNRETVELTDYVTTLINAGRLKVIEWHQDEAPLDAPEPAPVPTPEEVMAATLTAPAPPRRPRRATKEL